MDLVVIFNLLLLLSFINVLHSVNITTVDYEYSGDDGDTDGRYLNNDFVENSDNKSENDLVYKNYTYINEDNSENEQISSVINLIVENIRTVEDSLKQTIHEFIHSLELPADCLASFLRLVAALERNELWAYKFLGSHGAIPSGLIEGVTSIFGEYDQCLNIESNQSKNDPNIHGKYCLATPNIPFPSVYEFESYTFKYLNNETNYLLNKILTSNINYIKLFMANNYYVPKFAVLRIGICVPSNCEAEDIENAINKVLQPILTIPIEIGPKCDVKNEKLIFNEFQMTAIIILVMLSILVSMSTTIELLLRNKVSQNKLKKYLVTFSIVKSSKSLLSTKKESQEYIRTLTFMFILWTYVGRYYMSPLTINLHGFKRFLDSFIIQILSDKKYFWVWTSFPFQAVLLFSGVYISLDFFSTKRRKISPKSYFCFVLEKWIRFNIRCIGPILIIFLFSVLGEGPIWHLGEQFFVNSCQTNYWQNLFFLNSHVNKLQDICILGSVFMSIIFQLQIISPLIMIPILYSPKIGLILNISVILISSYASLLPKFFGLPIAPFEVSEMNSVDEIGRSMARYNVGSEQYFTPFFTGILVGYLIQNKSKFFKPSNKRLVSITLWILFPILSSSAIIWAQNFENINITPNKFDLLLWFSLGKILWASGLSCLILVLGVGSGGFVYEFLSLDMFKPLTRLSFIFLLVNTTVIYYRLFTVKDNIEITHFYLIQCIITDMIISYIISYFLYVLIEYPFNEFIKIFKKKGLMTDANLDEVNASVPESSKNDPKKDHESEFNYTLIDYTFPFE